MPEKKTRNKRWAKMHSRGYSLRNIAKLEKVHFTTVQKAIQPYKKLSTDKLARV